MISSYYRVSGFILLGLASLCAAGQQSIFLPHSLTLEQAQKQVALQLETGTLECAFDIHKVILNPSSKKQLALLATDPARFQLLSFLTSISLLKHALSTVTHISLKSIFTALPELTIEKFIEPIEQTHPKLVSLLIRMANALELNSDVAILIERLVEKQIPVRIASNINARIYDELKTQLAAEKKNIFSLFTRNDSNREGKVVNHGGICKPDERYFEEYTREFNPNNNKLFVFIDDKKENVIAAQKHGSFIGIVFTNAKQLESDLTTLGVLT